MSELDDKLNQAITATIWIKPIDESQRRTVYPHWFVANGQTFTFGVDGERFRQALHDNVMADVSRMQQDMANLQAQTVAELRRLQMTPQPTFRMVGEYDYKPEGTEIERVMSGRQWYDRFVKEMGDDARYCHGCSCDAMEAAKKAAGLE